MRQEAPPEIILIFFVITEAVRVHYKILENQKSKIRKQKQK